MSGTQFTVGKQCTVVLNGPFGQVQFSLVTGWQAKQNTHKLRVRPMNSATIGADLPDGWEGSFSIERADSTADDLFCAIEQAWWAGGVNLQNGTLYQYVNEVDGSESTYEFKGVTLTLSNAGNYQQDSTVKQTVDFFASTRAKL